MAERSVADLDIRALTASRRYFPSPVAWEDEVLYLLMLDRFSDGRETDYVDNDGSRVQDGATRPFERGDAGNAPRDAWVAAGQRFCGGTLRGVTTKIGYLHRLGVSAIWISPVFKQLASRDTYHGYGIQDFLDIDPRFGTRDDLRDLVRAAHDHGVRVILDIILNHTGDVFAYDPDRYTTRRPDGTTFLDPRWDEKKELRWGLDDRKTLEKILGASLFRGLMDRLSGPMIPIPTTPQRLIHADLMPEHLLLSKDGHRVVGVIDWADMAVGPVVCDFTFAASWLGKGFLLDLLDGYSGPDISKHVPWMLQRGLIVALENIVYGRSVRRKEYIRDAVRTIRNILS